jgi:hypothetical protein
MSYPFQELASIVDRDMLHKLVNLCENMGGTMSVAMAKHYVDAPWEQISKNGVLSLHVMRVLLHGYIPGTNEINIHNALNLVESNYVNADS